MDSNHRPYDYEASFERLDNIRTSTTKRSTRLPDRDKLTFNNGFYADCAALCVDIRGSSELPGKMKRPTLAAIPCVDLGVTSGRLG
jgi:hypothetical protein